MKKKIIMMVLVGLVAAFAARAQDALPFLTSRAFLVAYAEDQAVTAGANLYSPSQVGGQTTSWVAIIPPNHVAADILSTFIGQTYRISVLNGADPIYMGESVNNADNFLLFYGGSPYQPVLGKGGYYLPPVSVTLKMVDDVPVKFPKPVSNAEALPVDKTTGMTRNRQQVPTFGNTVFFPANLAGNSFLTVNFVDGTQSSYDLRPSGGGAKTVGTQITQQVSSASIENFVSYVDPWQIVDQIPAVNGIGTNRTYEVTMDSKQPWPNKVPFSVSTTEGFYPLGVWMCPKGSFAWAYVPWIPGQNHTWLPFLIGTWWVVPDWDPAQFSEPSPPDNDARG